MEGSNLSEHKKNFGLYESECQRLQREADEYTRRLVHENTFRMVTMDQIKTADTAMDVINNRIKSKIPNPEEDRRKLIN
jgi:hypothetical protein